LQALSLVFRAHPRRLRLTGSDRYKAAAEAAHEAGKQARAALAQRHKARGSPRAASAAKGPPGGGGTGGGDGSSPGAGRSPLDEHAATHAATAVGKENHEEF
jgi:hypothetical protein